MLLGNLELIARCRYVSLEGISMPIAICELIGRASLSTTPTNSTIASTRPSTGRQRHYHQYRSTTGSHIGAQCSSIRMSICNRRIPSFCESHATANNPACCCTPISTLSYFVNLQSTESARSRWNDSSETRSLQKLVT